MEYYRLHTTLKKSVPLIGTDVSSPDYLFQNKEIENPKPILLKFAEPVPPKPVMLDLLQGEQSFISNKVYAILNKISIRGVQLLPTIIKGKNIEYKNYFAIHSYTRIACVDFEKSLCQYKHGRLSRVRKIYLQEDILQQIPLESRLIFRLKESYSFELFHHNIVAMIQESDVKGFRFIPLSEWNASVFFT